MELISSSCSRHRLAVPQSLLNFPPPTRSGSTSNLINNKTDTPEFKSVADFVQRSRSEAGAVEFTLDGNRGEKKSQLCRILPRDAAAAAAGSGGAGGAGGVQKSADGRLLQCTEIAMEGEWAYAGDQRTGMGGALLCA